jgi:hypothetical protein
MMEQVMTPSRYIFLTGLFLVAVWMSGCSSERSRLLHEEYPSYSEGVRWAIDRGRVQRGMSQNQVYLALGSPVCKKGVDEKGRILTVWLYPPIGRDPCVTADFRVYFEAGVVTTWDRFTIPTRYTDPAGGVPAY